MRKTDSLNGSIDLLVLKILSRRGPLHGYGIALQIQEISEEALRVEEGSLYPALHRMEEAGMVRAEWAMTDSGRRARHYQISPAGKKQLALEEQRWQVVSSGVARILKFA